MEESENADSFRVSGRGELHLSVLIENMRREGYEFAVSKAEVLYKKDEKGKLLEANQNHALMFLMNLPERLSMVREKGELQNMSASNGGYTRLEFSIPARGLIGYRGEFMTDTKGNGILNTAFEGYAHIKEIFSTANKGSLILSPLKQGESRNNAVFSALRERGTLFIGPGEKVYSRYGYRSERKGRGH